jgi:tRNA (adenine57-N1/adenine58-N1)-methyltransferase
MAHAKIGDVAQLIGRDHKAFLVRLTPGLKFESHRGMIAHDDLIGHPYGTEVATHLGYAYIFLQPSTDDLIRELKRNSQIMFPKDIGFILMKLAIQAGVTVIEAGTGSGGMTTVLAQMVGDTGHVYSYDIRDDMQRLARKNLELVGLSHRVTFKQRNISAGFDETDVDAFFLDVPNPWDFTAQVRRALKGGGFFGAIVPTANQVSDLLVALQRDGYEYVEVCELLLRYYKVAPARLRPADRMVAHTCYLIFGRPITRQTPAPPPADTHGGEAL